MAITREDVLHIAKLAKLELEAEEVDGLMKDLASILGYVDELETLDTSSIAPTSHMGSATAPMRPDAAREGLTHEAALREAPRTAEGGFAVPAFVEEG